MVSLNGTHHLLARHSDNSRTTCSDSSTPLALQRYEWALPGARIQQAREV